MLGEFAAQRSRRALWISLANLVGVPLGAMSASVVMLVMSKTFTTSGWRVAMLLSVVIVIPALRARYKLADSPLFEQLRQSVKRLQTIHGTFHCEERSRGSMIQALSVPLSGTTGKLGPSKQRGPYIVPPENGTLQSPSVLTLSPAVRSSQGGNFLCLSIACAR